MLRNTNPLGLTDEEWSHLSERERTNAWLTELYPWFVLTVIAACLLGTQFGEFIHDWI